MVKPIKKRICIITHGLGGGGLERVAAMQSVYLSDSDYDVFIVTVLDKVDFSYKGKLLNLGVYKNNSNSKLSRIKRFLKLRSFIINNKIDLIIDHRPRKRWLSEWFISVLLYVKPTIYVVHSFKVSNYIPSKNRFFNRPYRLSKKVVSVSKAIEKKLVDEYCFSNIQTIYNPIVFRDFEGVSSKAQSLDFQYVLWYGRIENSPKNLKLLIDAYKLSELPTRNFKLVILGNGPDETMLKQYVKANDLNTSVVFINHTLDPLDYVYNAQFVVLTSIYEGFPMVLPEALSCGVPVISTDCQSGPNEIINHEINGLLVVSDDKNALSKAMNEFILNEKLYQKCKLNAKNSVRHLDVSEIKKEWLKIIEDE